MATPLAWLNLWHNKTRSLTAIAGVAFSAVLILMQLGFFTALQLSAVNVYAELDFDIVLSSTAYRIFSRAGSFPLERLALSRSDPNVVNAAPFWIGLAGWLNEHKQPPTRRGILVMAERPGDQLFKLPAVRATENLLSKTGSVLMDRASRPEFGPNEIGLVSTVGQTRVQIAGQFLLGSGFSADGAIITSDATFAELFPWFPANQTSLGLLKLREGADSSAVVAELRELLPPDVEVRTRAQVMYDEEYFWRTKTSVGTIFLLGIFVGILVGTSIVYQVMSSDIGNRIGEFATLKAMGYSSSYLTWNVLSQAAIIGVGGYLPAFFLSLFLYRITEQQAHIPMRLGFVVGGGVFLLSLAMCILSGLLSLRKVAQAAPADLF